MPTAPIGHKAGAKKVDVETYLPKPGDWEETNIIWDFGDGWLICEDRTEYDRRLMAKLTLTCVSGLIPRCIPDNSGLTYKEKEAKERERLKNLYPTITERDLKVELSYWRKSLKEPIYKLMHVRDPEQRPRSCILLATERIWEDPDLMRNAQYVRSNDLGQSFPVTLEDGKFRVCEVRIGTGKAAPMAVEERVIQWYQAVTGTWNEEAYLYRQIDRQMYGAFTNHPTDEALNEFRRAANAA